MLIRCAWCVPPSIMGEKEPLDDNSITDGICDDCLAKHFPDSSPALKCGGFSGGFIKTGETE